MNINALVRKNVQALQPYSSARDEYKDASADMVFIDANENPNNTGLNRYPDPQQHLVKEILADKKGLNINQILLGNGSDEVLDLLFRAFCEPGQDKVITLPPTYGMYNVLANINNTSVIPITLQADFQPNVSAILAAQDTTTKILFLCSPNNPTANSFNANAIEKLVKNFKGIVVIDEAYIDFSSQESWVSRLEEFRNLIVTQTLSKAYGLAGIRLGICYASPEIIAVLQKIKPPYNVNQLTQNTAVKGLLEEEKVKLQVADILRERSLVAEALRTIAFVEEVYPSDANFLLVKVDNATGRYEQLLNKGIVVRNRTKEPLCGNCLRFTIGTAYENNILIKALKSVS